MHTVRIPFRSLTLWALMVMRDTADTAGSSPVVPTVELQLALAWLASVRPGERQALDLFWQDARKHIPMENPHSQAYVRSLALKQRCAGVAERLLVGGEQLTEVQRLREQGLFQGAASAQSNAYIAERIRAYRKEQTERKANF